MTRRIKCLSLFSSIGIAETYFSQIGIDVVIANEIIGDRCKFYSHLHPKTEMFYGDITNVDLRESLIKKSLDIGIDFIIATHLAKE